MNEKGQFQGALEYTVIDHGRRLRVTRRVFSACGTFGSYLAGYGLIGPKLLRDARCSGVCWPRFGEGAMRHRVRRWGLTGFAVAVVLGVLQVWVGAQAGDTVDLYQAIRD